jgi:hypothetical protein
MTRQNGGEGAGRDLLQDPQTASPTLFPGVETVKFVTSVAVGKGWLRI